MPLVSRHMRLAVVLIISSFNKSEFSLNDRRCYMFRLKNIKYYKDT